MTDDFADPASRILVAESICPSVAPKPSTTAADVSIVDRHFRQRGTGRV
jgi:hypothetical protein